MHRLHYLFFFSLISSLSVFAQEIPPRPSPPRLVNDLADQLNATEEAALEKKLVAYNDSTSTQIALVIVPTVEPYAIADYAFKLGREWGVGQQGKNNGIVLLWAPNDRKVFIATGYGMEGAIPDAIAKRIVSQEIIPEFKNEMYYRGLDRGIDALIQYAAGEYKGEPTNASDEGFPSGLTMFIIIFIIVMIIISRNKGGGSGGRGYRSSGGPIIWPYNTHSGWGSSSGSWGNSGGGGFGGFGGGSFGGGGAGGSY